MNLIELRLIVNDLIEQGLGEVQVLTMQMTFVGERYVGVKGGRIVNPNWLDPRPLLEEKEKDFMKFFVLEG